MCSGGGFGVQRLLIAYAREDVAAAQGRSPLRIQRQLWSRVTAAVPGDVGSYICRAVTKQGGPENRGHHLHPPGEENEPGRGVYKQKRPAAAAVLPQLACEFCTVLQGQRRPGVPAHESLHDGVSLENLLHDRPCLRALPRGALDGHLVMLGER